MRRDAHAQKHRMNRDVAIHTTTSSLLPLQSVKKAWISASVEEKSELKE